MTVTNDAARAYAAMAAKNSGFTLDEIGLLVNEMTYLMDICTEKEILDKAEKLLDGEAF